MISNGQDTKEIDVPNRINMNSDKHSPNNGLLRANGSNNGGPTMKGNIGPLIKKNDTFLNQTNDKKQEL